MRRRCQRRAVNGVGDALLPMFKVVFRVPTSSAANAMVAMSWAWPLQAVRIRPGPGGRAHRLALLLEGGGKQGCAPAASRAFSSVPEAMTDWRAAAKRGVKGRCLILAALGERVLEWRKKRLTRLFCVGFADDKSYVRNPVSQTVL
jgi:hypothetical protein